MCEEGEENGTSLLTGTRRVKAAALKDPMIPLDGGKFGEKKEGRRCVFNCEGGRERESTYTGRLAIKKS